MSQSNLMVPTSNIEDWRTHIASSPPISPSCSPRISSPPLLEASERDNNINQSKPPSLENSHLRPAPLASMSMSNGELSADKIYKVCHPYFNASSEFSAIFYTGSYVTFLVKPSQRGQKDGHSIRVRGSQCNGLRCRCS